jgi:hypothetical protein
MSDPEFRMYVEAARVELVSTAIGLAAEATVGAVETVTELMRTAQSESVRLRAASVLLEFVGDHGTDPVKNAIRGATTFSGTEVAALVRRLTEAGLAYISDEMADTFLNDLEAAIRAGQ